MTTSKKSSLIIEITIIEEFLWMKLPFHYMNLISSIGVPQNNGIFISTNSIPVYYVAKIWAKNRIKIPKRPTIGYPGHINTINYKSSYAWALWNYTPGFFSFSCIFLFRLSVSLFVNFWFKCSLSHFIWCKEFFQIVSCILFVVYIFRIFFILFVGLSTNNVSFKKL